MKEIEQALANMPINQENPNPTPSVAQGPGLDNSTPAPQQPQQHAHQYVQPKTGIDIGPKYLSALEKVAELADVRAITTQLPISMDKVSVSPMTGTEEQNLRTRSSDPETFLANVNRLLYDHSEFTSGGYSSFDEFLKKLYPHDKTLLVWALLTATYSTLPSMEKLCSKCGEPYEIVINPEGLLKQDGMPIPWAEAQGPEDFVLTSTILDGQISFEIGLPSEERRLQIASVFSAEQLKQNVQESGNIMSFSDNLTYFIKRVVVKDPTGDIILTHPINDIYPFMMNLPPKVKDLVKGSANLEYFDKYMADFYEMTNCSHCQHEEKIEIIPEIEFFRKALSVY